MDSAGSVFAAPDHAQAQDLAGIGFVRPHEMEVARLQEVAGIEPGAQGIVVRLVRSHAIGPLAQLELAREDNAELIEAVISNERFAQLDLQAGERLLVRPKRLRVFVDHAN